MKSLLKEKNLFFFIPLIIIITISLIDMYYIKALSDLYQYHFIKELSWIIIGFSLLIIISNCKLKFIIKLSPYLYYGSLLLLILVLIIGNNTNGARAWFRIGFIKIQPSEIMKISLILYLNKINHHHDLIYIIKIFILTLIPSILVFLEPDTGAIIIYGLIALSTIFSKNINKKYKIIIFMGLLIIGILMIYLLFFKLDYFKTLIGSYRLNRIINLKNGYQIDNAKTAIGSADFLNITINKPILYIPEAPTDFIFAFSVGNMGIVIGLLIILSYYLITIFILNTNNIIKNNLLTIFLFQVIYNLGFNIGIFPIMGIPLPFLSYGGSNIIIYFLMFGILLNKDGNSNYSRKNNRDKYCNKALGKRG